MVVHTLRRQVFKALDFVLVEARRYGLRVILSVLDNWKYSGGIDEFVDWSATSPRRTRERPADKAGDTATHVRATALVYPARSPVSPVVY